MTRYEIMKAELSPEDLEKYINNVYNRKMLSNEEEPDNNKTVYEFLNKDTQYELKDCGHILDHSFVWEYTDEGHEYWDELNEKMVDKYDEKEI